MEKNYEGICCANQLNENYKLLCSLYHNCILQQEHIKQTETFLIITTNSARERLLFRFALRKFRFVLFLAHVVVGKPRGRHFVHSS